MRDEEKEEGGRGEEQVLGMRMERSTDRGKKMRMERKRERRWENKDGLQTRVKITPRT